MRLSNLYLWSFPGLDWIKPLSAPIAAPAFGHGRLHPALLSLLLYILVQMSGLFLREMRGVRLLAWRKRWHHTVVFAVPDCRLHLRLIPHGEDFKERCVRGMPDFSLYL